MGRRPNLCGQDDLNFRALYFAIDDESSAANTPVPLGGPASNGIGWGYDPEDPSKAIQVFIERAWGPDAWWLAFRYANGIWDSYPCVVSAAAVKRTVTRRALAPLRWVNLGPARSLRGYPNRAAESRHTGRRRANNSTKMTDGVCISLMGHEGSDSLVTLNLQARPHIAAPSRKIDLLSAFGVFDLNATVSELQELQSLKLPLLGVPFTMTVRQEELLSVFFTRRGDDYLVTALTPSGAATRNRMLASLAVTDPDLEALEAPDGAHVDGMERVGDTWEPVKSMTVKEFAQTEAGRVQPTVEVDEEAEEEEEDELTPEEEEGLA